MTLGRYASWRQYEDMIGTTLKLLASRVRQCHIEAWQIDCGWIDLKIDLPFNSYRAQPWL